MTKADLIEEVSRVVEMTRKEAEVIVEAISIALSGRCGAATRLKFGALVVFGHGSASPAWAAIQKRERGWKSLLKNSLL